MSFKAAVKDFWLVLVLVPPVCKDVYTLHNTKAVFYEKKKVFMMQKAVS